MGALGDILGKVLEILTDFIPRPIFVPKRERAAVWLMWWGPWSLYGPFIHWPIFMDYELYDIREDATVFDAPVLWSKDGKEVAIGAVLTWRVVDPKIVATEINDFSDWVGEKVESILPKLVAQYTLEDLQRKVAGGEGREWGLNRHLFEAAKAFLEPRGFEVIDVRINFTAKTRVFRLLQSD